MQEIEDFNQQLSRQRRSSSILIGLLLACGFIASIPMFSDSIKHEETLYCNVKSKCKGYNVKRGISFLIDRERRNQLFDNNIKVSVGAVVEDLNLIDDTYYLEKQNWFLTWSKSSHHWFSFVFLTGTPAGGSQTHSPVVKFAYMCSFVRGSIISTHSVIGGCGEHGAPVVVPPAKGFRISESGVNGLRLILRRALEVKSPIRI